ncbi:DoxX family protein [Rhizobium sp. Leaf262]|uniref:DoxX family protein n=1 Tax=Rhizobium sp. Leaf262 TaxID=1736312 RepID=UPI0007162982|nr:DoxX family protein [Rhizobium sp. Leaf262]KQO83308.1 DoxX family protein [Rhizobium sp. Leaf262]
MTDHSTTQNAPKTTLSNLLRSPVSQRLALLALCAAYIQGPVTKIFDFHGAIAEMNHFGLSPAPVFAIAVIVFELVASAMVISGFLRWAAALSLVGFTLLATLVALRFWELPSGMDRMMATNAFFEHLGLAGAFIIVAAMDLAKGAGK